ncbi:MAG: tetratricopeptide repeat protein [Prosthecobacter sp.]|uniref:tetratricopeptide repeat protein n=1 Tax=Prosthecobacter sp. TaxID=1965333 RepID=UPI00260AC217|nr:tetratricopeptide repeat protein [Prosthecobacter sp.]MCF7788663.1 tetratricopeptide repeat protein [Prosthecobacter sp.]
MHPRIALYLLLFVTNVSAQTPAVVVPAPAQRYLDILIKRPQPGTIFERFYAAWLEESSTTDLDAFLEALTQLPAATAADHLLLAVFHSHRGDDRAALAAYEAALKLDPANASAWMERSRLEARALDFAAALQSLDEAVKAQPDAASTMEIGKLRGRALLRLGKNEEALRTWKELAASHAEDEDLSEELIDLLTDEGQYEAALETAQALIKRSRDPVARTLRQLRLTDILLLAERRDEALKTLRETLASTGSDSWVEGDVLGRISRVFRMSDDVAGFEKFLADLVKEHPQRVALAWQHTQLLGETGQKDAALKEARALLQSNPGRRDLHEGFLDLLESLDLVKEAVEQALTLTQQNAADKEMLMRLAGLQHRAMDDAAALSTLERFLKLAGAGEADHLRAARLLENWEEAPAKPGSPAAKSYARLVENFPASVSAQEAQAHYLHRNGQREAALAIWTRLAKSATLEDLLRITQALQARQESRTALDLLAPREKDFAREPRFFALLVQLAIANKEVERALPWARTRLRLAQDAESIETAVKDILLVLRSDESGKLSSPMLQELQSQATLTIQNRSLLAALLESASKNADAEKTLNSAPAEDQLIALSQLSMLFQTRQEWEKAAQTLQQVIALPGARTTARVQRMVDFYRRAEKPEQALTWIAEWKKLSPSAVQPWLDESRLLIALNRSKDAQALLRGALRKFPDSIEAASSYATLCLENGQPDEAERTYLALYEKTTDATARLRLIGPLALASQQHNSLPRLIENFQQRQKQNRASAQPWLALAEIHRATNNDEERRRCLYEASRLRPQDLALLLDIARSEEEIGLTAEALRTLESAAKLDKTTKTRENIARLQIDSGDADLGYRMLFELAGGSQMDARAIEQMADTIAENGEWERVIAFLEPVLEKHPKDYRLHYLNAVALEEAGREKEAVRAFIEIMSMHEELPGALSTGRSIGLRQQYAAMSLPPGTEDWLVLPTMVHAAYIHRQKQGGRANYGSYNTFGSTTTNGLPTNGFIQQAPGVTESPVLALAHVLQMVSVWDLAEREPVLRSLKQAGVSDAPLLLTAAENSPQLVITPEMLTEHPQNAALHAAWLMQSQRGDPAEFLPIFESAFKLFQSNHPELALRTAALAWRTAGDQSPVWVRRILDICQSLPKAGYTEVQTLIGLLRSQADMFALQSQGIDAVKLSTEEVHAITTFLQSWLNTVDDQQPYYFSEIIMSFAAVKDWEGLVKIIQHRLSLPDKPQSKTPTTAQPAIQQGRNRGYYRNFQPSLMPMPVLSFKLPSDALKWVSGLSTVRDSEQSPLSEEQKKWIQEIHAGLQPFIDKTQESSLKLVLRLITGEQQAMLDELAPRLISSPSLDDLLLAGWLSQQLNQHEKAFAFFQQAQALTTDAAQILQLDLTMLYQALRQLQQQGKREIKTLPPAVKPVLERLSQAATTREEKLMLAETMNSFGMQEEAQKLVQTAQGSPLRSRSQNAPVIANPYSRSYSYRQQQKKQVSLDELLKKGDQAGAVKELVRQLRLAIQGCLNPQNSSSAHHQIHNVIKLFTQHKLTDQVVEAMQTGSGWKARQEYAVLLEHTGLETKPAIDVHRAVISANPRAFASHARLATLLAMEGDFQTALQHWKKMPDVTQAQYLPALIHELSERSDISVPRPAALSGLLSIWLRSLPASRPLPSGSVQQFQQALTSIQSRDFAQNLSTPDLWSPFNRENSGTVHQWKFNEDGSLNVPAESQKIWNERRAAHDQLCKAMLEVPELALMGFAPLGGMAMLGTRNLAETEKIALDQLSLRAMPKVKRRLMAQGHYPQHYGSDPFAVFTGLFATAERIAMPTPAVFATYCAAQRGDQHQLDEVVFPAILKAEGKSIEQYCRAYAALLMADEEHFVSAASAWLYPPGKGNDANRSQQPGGPLEEIVRQWETRKIKALLNPLFLALSAKPANGNFANQPQITKTYAFALGQHDPEAMRSFIRSLRDPWIGATPELRSQSIALWQEYQVQQQRGVPLPAPTSRSNLQAVQSYIQWLQNLLQDPRALPLLDLAIEDGLMESPQWLRQITSSFSSSRFHTVENFMQTADALGFIGENGTFRTYLLNDNDQRSTLLGRLAQHYRDNWNDEKVNAALSLLSQRKPTLGADIAQALLMKNDHTPLQLDGRTVPLYVSQTERAQSRNGDGGAYRSAALRLVLIRHAKDISAMPATGQSELSALLRLELNGYPQSEQLGEELARILAPLLKFEIIELTRQVDQVLAAKTWSDLHQQEYEFAQQFPALLGDFADSDPAKADAAARHAVELLRGSPEQKQSLLQNSSETCVIRLLRALLRVPQLLHTTLALADQEGISQSRGWTSNLRSYMEESLNHPEKVRFVFTGTPWVAEASDFRDPKSDNPQEPTLLSSLINQIEYSNDNRSSIHDFLAKQPATFGTELLLAFLHRAPGDTTNSRSFYNTRRPDDSAILAFIQKRHDEFASLQPESAANLLAMLNARMPDLDQKSEQDAALKQALQPLINATAVQLEADITHWMQMTRLSSSGSEGYEIMQNCQPVLDHLAQSDKPRAIALLDHISQLLAQQDAMNSRGGSRQPPHQTQVAQWLQKAAFVPELFGEIMQRAEASGAASDPSWLASTLNTARNVHNHRGKPRRFIALLEAAGMLDPAATFNPRPLPNNPQQYTMLDVMLSEFTGGDTHPGLVEELNKRQPRTFGVDLIILHSSKNHTSHDEVTAFAQTYADEIAACSAEQKKVLSGYILRRKWVKIFAANVPGLQEEFAPVMKEQQAKLQTFIEELLKITTWQELESIYIKSLPPSEQSTFNRRMPGGLQYYSTGGLSYLGYFADQLQQMGPADIHKFEQVLQLIGRLYRTEFSQSPLSNRMPPLNSFVLKLCSTPRLAPKALQFGAQYFGVQNIARASGPGNMSISESQLISAALPDATVASAERLVSSLDAMGLLADAATYDAVSLPSFRMRSVLALTLNRLSSLSPDQAEKTAQLLIAQKGAAFGHYLFAACLTAKNSPEKSRRLDLCTSQFPRLNPQAAGAVLDVFESHFPELGKAELAEGELSRFAPLLKLRTAEERSYIDAILAGRREVPSPFRGYTIAVRNELLRLLESSRPDDLVKFVLALSRRLDPEDTSTLFAKEPYFRAGGPISYFFQSQLRFDSEESPALLACQMLAAANLPEVRLEPVSSSSQSPVKLADQLFHIWEHRGGWAAPKAVWTDFMQQVARYDTGNTRGLWLPVLHSTLVQMGVQERREVAEWAAEQGGPGLQTIRHECRIALDLIQSTEPMFGWLDGPYQPLAASPSAMKTWAAATQQARALLKDEQIKTHVRLELAAWLTAAYPGLLDEEARQSWGLAAAKAWHDGVPITRHELAALLNSAAVLPVNDTWKQTSSLVLERWDQLEAIIRSTRVRYLDQVLYHAIVRLSASSENTAAVEKLINAYGTNHINEFTGILLEKGDWQHAIRLKSRSTLPSYNASSKRHGWLPPTESTLREMQASSLEDALLAEVIALSADDTATCILYPEAHWQPRRERLAAFAKKVAASPLPEQPVQRAQTLVILAKEQPESALILLPQFDAISKVLTSDSLGEYSFSERYWVDFLAVHAALKTATGDFAAADASLERLRTDRGIINRHGTSTDSLGGYFRSTLFQCLAHFWAAGTAREPEKLLQFAALSGAQAGISDYGFLSQAALQSSISAWQLALKQEPLPAGSADPALGVINLENLMEFLSAMAGTGKQRLPFPQRLALIARMSGQTKFYSPKHNFWSQLVQYKIFTTDELLKNKEAVLKISSSFAPAHLEDYAQLMREQGMFKAASQLYACALERWSQSKSTSIASYTQRCVIGRVEMQIRLGDLEEGRQCLGQYDETLLNPIVLARRATLLKLLSPNAQAPAR